MIKLETLKRNCFLDYKSVDRYLSNNKSRNNGMCSNDVTTVTLTDKTYMIDDMNCPLSSSLIVD